MTSSRRIAWQDYLGARYAQLNPLALRGELSLSEISAGLSSYLDDENVQVVLLGGSYSKGTARPYSDVDVYIVKRASNVPFYRQAIVNDGIAYELNFIEQSYYGSVIEGMQKSRRASLVYSLAFARVLKGELQAKALQALALEVWQDTASSAVYVQRLMTGLQESILGNVADFVVEHDVMSAQVVATSVLNDCYSLLSLTATGWLHRGRHAVAAIQCDPQSRALFDELLMVYPCFLLKDERAALADVVCAIVELARCRQQVTVV